MQEILIEGKRLRLRRATIDDINYIMALQFAPENLRFIVPFEREYHEKIIKSDNTQSLDVIIEERETKYAAGYFMIRGLDTDAKEMEWTHVIIGRKGLGYGHEAMKLLKAWTFLKKKFHRAWLDCKDYNEIAIHLYESEGLVREGLIRETLLTDGVYENLLIFGILDREYRERRTEGKELSAWINPPLSDHVKDK